MPRPRKTHTHIEARIREKNQRRGSLTGSISNSIITVDSFLSRYISMKTDLPQNYQQLQRALSRVGYFRRGTLLKRFMACGKPGCACQASPPRLHGPYYQWTRKVDGKTVTVRLTREQADLLASWIATGRELDRIIAQMERMSLRATDRLLKKLPPPARKTPTPRIHGKRAPES
jgi:hypothetical protein